LAENSVRLNLESLPEGLLFARIKYEGKTVTLRGARLGTGIWMENTAGSKRMKSILTESPHTDRKSEGLGAKSMATRTLTFSQEGFESSELSLEGNRENLVIRLASIIPSDLEWKRANLTWYTSYPDPNSEECIVYNGCQWAGQFAALQGQQPKEWVEATNIAAVHSKDFNSLKLKTLRLKQGTRKIDVKVYDMCADSDCDGCCTQNAGGADGFLIDVESHTRLRFGTGSGPVDWVCLDCL
jgi:hypothetical protein